MNPNHSKFLSHLDESEATRWLVAKWLSSKGRIVRIPPVAKAPSHEDWMEYADEGDLEISQRIEVKRLSREFTSATDWPFGSKFIVCARHAFDRARPRPYAFVIVNRSGTHAAMITSDGCKSWTVETRSDSRYSGVTQEFYMAPMEQVMFSRID